MRLLYIHAYQSLIWNKVASRRIKTWGLELHPGDLILIDKTSNVTEIIECDVDQTETTEDDDVQEEENNSEISIQKGLARHLTEKDIASNEYTIADVVLPLPGFDIFYPNNETADWYTEYLASDDLDTEKLKQKIKLYSLPGSYRKLIEIPQSVDWSLKTYNSSDETLIESDYEKIQKQKIESENEMCISTTDKQLENDSSKKAVVLNFNLSSSCYATMALREILKIDTSVSSQIKLNNTIIQEEQLKRQKDSEGDSASVSDNNDINECKRKIEDDEINEENDVKKQKTE